MYNFVKPLRLGWIAHIFDKYRKELKNFRRKSNIKNYWTDSPTRNIRQKSADFLIGVFKEETILNVWQSISKVRKKKALVLTNTIFLMTCQAERVAHLVLYSQIAVDGNLEKLSRNLYFCFVVCIGRLMSSSVTITQQTFPNINLHSCLPQICQPNLTK